MKPKLAPRHIIPAVCYAILFAVSALVAIYVRIGLQNFSPASGSSSAVEETLPLIGLLAVGIAAAAVVLLFFAALLAAVFAFVPLLLSSINMFKRNRKLAIACLVFDILTTEFLFFPFVSSLISATTLVIPLLFAGLLALPILSLVMNVLNIKQNGPLPQPTTDQAPVENTAT